MPVAVRPLALAAAFAVVAFVVGSVPAAPAAADQPPVTYTPPVEAPISEPFRAPAGPYGPGHRGIEYDTAPGTDVHASAPGTVVFAGSVAGTRWVTVSHRDGVRTTYGPLADVAVRAGQPVDSGEVLGATLDRLLLTARVAENYVDPALLLSTEQIVHLVAEPYLLPSIPSSAFGLDDLLTPDALVSALTWAGEHAEQKLEAAYNVTPVPIALHTVGALWEWEQAECTHGGAIPPPPPGRHFAVLVGGLGSSSDGAAIDDLDTSSLGYGQGDVVRFSYSGGRIPASHPVSPELAGLDVSTYGARDTVSGLDDAGNRLAELLSATVAAAPPGTTLDLYAHSQGGLVLRLALADLADTNPGVFFRLGVVVTIATPHQGAELAGLVDAVKSDPGGTELLDAAGDALGLDYRAEDPVVDELAPGSDVIRRLAAEPLPPGPTYVSIAARADLVVPSPDAHLDGAENITVPVAGLTAHDDVPGSPSTEHEIILARAGLPPSCESASDVVLDTVSGDLVQSGEQLLTSLAAP